MSDEQRYTAGAGRIVPAPIMLVLRRMEMPERITNPEDISYWMWTKHESDAMDMEMADLKRRQAEECCKAQREALEDVAALLEQLPTGYDEEAEEGNLSPDDAVAHVAGLIWQRIRQVRP